MGKCKYCGCDAGLFQRKHQNCEQRYQEALLSIKQIILDCFFNKEDFYLRDKQIKLLAQSSYVNNIALGGLFITAFDEAIDRYLDNGIIDEQEEKTIARFIQYSNLPQDKLNANKSLEKVIQSKVLQDIFAGNVPAPRISIAGNFPFLLDKTEHLVWLFRNITLYQQKFAENTLVVAKALIFE